MIDIEVLFSLNALWIFHTTTLDVVVPLSGI